MIKMIREEGTTNCPICDGESYFEVTYAENMEIIESSHECYDCGYIREQLGREETYRISGKTYIISVNDPDILNKASEIEEAIQESKLQNYAG